MQLFLKLLGGLLIWSIITFILMIIILTPREATYQKVTNSHHYKGGYDYSYEQHQNNVGTYFKNIIDQKSLGRTNVGSTVEEELFHYFKRTLTIMIPALIISFLLGIIKGVYDYRQSLTRKNWLGNGTTWVLQSLPEFFIIVSVQFLLLFLMKNGFPKLDIYGYDHWYNIFLPIFFLSLYPLTYISRITSTAMSDQENKDYITTAKAKGVSEANILFRHMLWNCWSKILSQFLTIMLILISSSIIVEYLTFYRGAGKRLLEALQIKKIFMVGSHFPVEVPTVIGFSLGYMLLILISLSIQVTISHFLIPVKKEDI